MIRNRRSFIIGLKSTKLSSKEKFFIKKFKPWGIILFSRNIKSVNQCKELIFQIRKVFKDKKYPILIDQEGGRVNRLSKIIDLSFYTSKFFGDLYKQNKKKFIVNYKIFIDKTSFYLRLLGININTVPVLDLYYKNTSKNIGDRSFSSNVDQVSKFGDLCIKYFHENSIGTIMKHIPGHGLAKKDSHKFTPIISKKYNYLLKKDFSAFKKKKCLFAMTAHVIYKDIDNINTVTHSRKIIDIIRKKIKYKNLLISDDISMKSLKFSIKENTKKAFSAGCNLVLHCSGNYKEMCIVAKNSPTLDKFVLKKTSEFYDIIS